MPYRWLAGSVKPVKSMVTLQPGFAGSMLWVTLTTEVPFTMARTTPAGRFTVSIGCEQLSAKFPSGLAGAATNSW